MIKKLFKIALFFGVVFTIYLGVLYSIQNELLFYPSKNYISPDKISLSEFSENLIRSSDGTDIMTWYHEGDADKPAILFFHGNGGQIATFAPSLRPISNAGYSVLIMEYRGFGNTTGNISQQEIVQDATLAFDWLKNKGHSKIIVYGYSFGTAFASALTKGREPDGLILVAPFSSLEKLISEKPVPFAKWALKDKYMSVNYLKKYTKPLLIIHGTNDTLIPYHHAQILFDNAASEEKQLKLIENETHSSLFFGKKIDQEVLDFLQQF